MNWIASDLVLLGTNFTALDWSIVGLYMLGTIVVGLLANRLIHDMADYIVAGRSLRSFISVATMLGSEIGLVTVMYTSQKGFTSGFSAFHIGILAGVGCLVVGLTGFIVVPLREAGVMTIPEYYGQRFGQGVRVLGGLILSVAGLLNMGVFLKAGALFIAGATGIVDQSTINLIMVLLITIVLIYTILGGMVSVVITDYIQFVILSLGLLLSCLFAYRQLGWTRLVETVRAIHGSGGFDPLESTGFGLDYVVWMLFAFGIVACSVWPTAVMRACSAESPAVVKRLYAWSSIGFMTRMIIPQFLGICALAYFWQHQDPRFFVDKNQLVPDTQQTLMALPIYLGDLLPTGILGLITAGMLAAFMSTHDSYMLCWASVIVEDVISPLCPRPLATVHKLRLARLLILLIGIFLLVWSLWYPMQQDMLDYLAVSGAIYFTGAFAVLCGGLYWQRASRTGATLALLAGGLAILGLPPVQKLLGLTAENLGGYQPKDSHIGLAVSCTALVLMVAGSLLFPDKPQTSEAAVSQC